MHVYQTITRRPQALMGQLMECRSNAGDALMYVNSQVVSCHAYLLMQALVWH